MLSNKEDHKKGVIALILLALCFASMGLFARYLATGFLLFQQVYLRMLAALIIGFFALRSQLDLKKFARIPVQDWIVIIVRGVTYSLFGIILFTQAIVITKYSNVSFIGSLPTAGILGILFLHERLTIKKAGFILLAVMGAVILAVTNFSNIFSWGRGETLTLISTVSFGISYIGRRWQTKFLNNSEMTVLNFVVAFFAVFIVSIVKGDGLPVTGWTFGLLSAVIGAGIFNIANVFLTNYDFEKVEAVLASNILTLESFFAIILGFLFYHEVPFIKELVGGIIIIGSVIGMNELEKRENKR